MERSSKTGWLYNKLVNFKVSWLALEQAGLGWDWISTAIAGRGLIF